MSFVLQFVVVAALVAVALWAIQQFPVDATIVKFIRVVLIVLLSVFALNVLLVLLVGKSLTAVIGGGA